MKKLTMKGAFNDRNNPCKDNNEKYLFNSIKFKFYKGWTCS